VWGRVVNREGRKKKRRHTHEKKKMGLAWRACVHCVEEG
jgi:hypothetical protein